MISYSDFGKLRLDNFLSAENISRCTEFEFMDDIWTGLCYGFTEWLQLEREPTKTQSISLDLQDLPEDITNDIFSVLQLDLYTGMNIDSILKSFGEPHIEQYSGDRKSLIYLLGHTELYYLSLTIDFKEGLTYLVMMNHANTINNLHISNN